MELLRTRSDAWGQQVLEGVNLDLVVWFLAAGAALILVHALAVAWSRRKSQGGE